MGLEAERFDGREKVLARRAALFEEQGFVLVSGLIGEGVVLRAHRRLLERMPVAGSAPLHHYVRDRCVSACFTPQLCAAAQQLIGSPAVLRPPTLSYAITAPASAGSWETPHPHIDHALENDRHRSLPPAFRLGCLIYLNSVPSHSGATVVWPGSHIHIEKLAKADPEKYEYRSALNRDLPALNLGVPVEVTAAAGDVLFYHHFLAHAGSRNTGREARVALNHKW